MENLTEKEFTIIAHTLGVTYRTSIKELKKLPEKYYRNYFCCSTEEHDDYPILKSLEEKGYSERYKAFDGQLFFFITDSGKKIFENIFKEMKSEKV